MRPGLFVTVKDAGVSNDKAKDRPSAASFKVGAIALAFLIIGYQAALVVGRAARLRIEANRDKPDTVFVYYNSAGQQVGSSSPQPSGDAGPLPLPSEAGPSLLRSRGWLRFSEAVAVSTTPAAAVSSTKIRKALEEGRVEEAEAMLGYAYGLRGVVVSGKQLGRTLGFPTANLRLYDPLKLVPARGVYLTEVEVLGGHYWGMTNVAEPIETHIFDFSEDIYGLDLEIRFRRWLRPMRRMESLDDLSAQLAADEAACRELLSFIK